MKKMDPSQFTLSMIPNPGFESNFSLFYNDPLIESLDPSFSSNHFGDHLTQLGRL